MKLRFLSLLSLLLSFTSHAQWSGQWNSVQNMGLTRSQHLLFALADGKVLAAGGWGGSINLKDCELNDAGVNGGSFQWVTTTFPMNSAHTTGAGVLLPNAKPMAIGGFTGSINTHICEVYDTSAETWSLTDSLAQGRSFHTATVLQNGKVLVTGGYDGTNNLTSCELYDPATNTWSNTATGLTTGRSYHTATLMNDGRVLVCGGFNPSAGFQLGSVEIYDPATNAFSAGPNMANTRAWHAASCLADGRVLVTGGEHFNGGSPYAYNGMTSCELYNPTTNSWSAAANLPNGVCYNQQFTLAGNRVLMVAGAGNTNYSGSFSFSPTTTYVYDVAANSWTDYPMTLDGRVNFAAAQIDDKTVMVCGGIDQVETEYFKVDIQTETVKAEASSLFSVHPNPSSGVFSVDMRDGTLPENIQVFNAMGQQINAPLLPSANASRSLDLSAYPIGIYTLQLDRGDKTESIRLVLNP